MIHPQTRSNKKVTSSSQIAKSRQKKFVFDLSAERLMLLIINMVIIVMGFFFVFEASSLESYAISMKNLPNEEEMLENPEADEGDVWILTRKQFGWFLIGLVALVIAAFFPKEWWIKLAPAFYVLAIILLIMVFIPPFKDAKLGAARWIDLGFASFQPIELVKFCLVTFFAWLLIQKGQFFEKHGLPFFLVCLGLPLVLIYKQPDFASLTLITVAVLMMYFLSGVRWRNIFIVGGLGFIALLIAMFGAKYRRERIFTYLGNNQEISQGDTWHTDQIRYAFGRGGLFGVGIGNSKQKYNYLPEPSSDSILAIVGEEVGFLGVSIVIGLYVLYFFLAWKIIGRSEMERGQRLMGYGLITLLCLQTLVYLTTISGLIPLTGITLPFFSYGGSSLLASMFTTGVILGLSRPTAGYGLGKKVKASFSKKSPTPRVRIKR